MVPLSGSPLFSISQGFRIVAYTAPSINHTPRRGRAFPFADASADQGRGPAAGRADRALAGIGQDREGHRAGRGVTGERVRPRSRCLLFGVEQTSWWRTATSQFDPKRKEVALNDAKLVGAMSCRFRDPELNLETRFNVSKSTKLLVTVSRV